ncbi:MAG: amidohydrolase family protein, partial [Atopobiaceae bacterium]|nr:amidohydrolase family protein [Atopobiaceae bacterium]
KIADKATQSVGQFYNIPMQALLGSVGNLLKRREDTPITHSIICSVAVKPANVNSINDFIAKTCAEDDTLVGLAAMHQDFEDVGTELDRAMSMGLRGVKLHPDTQGVNMDDPRLMHVYEECEKRGLPLLIHCGDYRYDYSHPRRLKRILHEFPQLEVCAAHFGGWSVYDLALEYLEDERCFLDVSSSMRYLGLRRTRELIEDYGVDRMMFGSDFPMWDPGEEQEAFSSLGFSKADYERMCWHNAERWLGVDIV